MKKHFLKSFALLAMLFSAMTMSAATYCGELITSTNGKHTAKITCSSVGSNQYQFVFESTDEFTGYNADGSNFYMEVNGIGGTQVSKNLTQDGKKLFYTFESTVVPNIYVGAFYVNYADGESMFDIPIDEDFSAPFICNGTLYLVQYFRGARRPTQPHNPRHEAAREL